jgi:hypothetical protein
MPGEQMQRLLEVCFLKDLGLNDPAHNIIQEPLPNLIWFDDVGANPSAIP